MSLILRKHGTFSVTKNYFCSGNLLSNFFSSAEHQLQIVRSFKNLLPGWALMSKIIASKDEFLGREHSFVDENRLLEVGHDTLREISPAFVN
jgi:hypothetical protein